MRAPRRNERVRRGGARAQEKKVDALARHNSTCSGHSRRRARVRVQKNVDEHAVAVMRKVIGKGGGNVCARARVANLRIRGVRTTAEEQQRNSHREAVVGGSSTSRHQRRPARRDKLKFTDVCYCPPSCNHQNFWF